MRRPFDPKSRHLGQTSDLTLFAPIKKGMVGSLDAITYRSRVKRTLEVLHSLRSRSHEHTYVRLISDAVERVAAIQSVRVLIVEPQDCVMLSVTFDGNWDSYLRVLWHKVGALLDLIFCNTEGYVDAGLNRFEDWAAWVRRVQTETSFFYGSPAVSARDPLFQRRQERRRLAQPASNARDFVEATDVLPPAEREPDSLADDPELNLPNAPEMWIATALRQGLRGAAALHRMADMYRPGSADGDRLHRAAIELLREFVTKYRNGVFEGSLDLPEGRLRERFARELAWLFDAAEGVGKTRPEVEWPKDPTNVQGGILDGWQGVTHAALVLVTFADPGAAARFMDRLRPELATAATEHALPRGKIVKTLALTNDGLYSLGADSSLLDVMPEAFRQGMAARAGLLGDVHSNHPDRWRPPTCRVGTGRVALESVHAIVQLRINVADDALLPVVDTADPRHPLHAAIDALDRLVPGASVVAVEPMRRLYKRPTDREGVHEHFGFPDGQGQPQIAKSPPKADYAGNVLPVGELLLGYGNSGDIDRGPDGVSDESDDWLRDGSFLVVRKYRQYVDRFDAAIAGLSTADGSSLDPEVVAGKLMGRDRQGRPVVDPTVIGNAFDYTADRDGRLCPLTAHIRRGNPRAEAPTGDRPPGSRAARIVRRSLSYGPTVQESPSPEAERGLVFMAYNASLSEQFEVVQRWMVGGNSTGSSSFASCPMLGVPESGRVRHFRFAHQGEVLHVALDGHGPLFDDPQPMVRLEWGAYLWVPSLKAIERLVALAGTAGGAAETAWDLARGRELLSELQRPSDKRCPRAAIGAWKSALEDIEAMSSFDSASLWAVIREDHGGVLRTPYGVLVGDHTALHRALSNAESALSVSGYQHRLRHSLGEIYLGLDDKGPGCRYREEAGPVNDAIGKLDAAAAFTLARDSVIAKIDALVAQAKASAVFAHDPHFETVFEPRELFDEILAQVCEAWCGLSEAGGRLSRGPLRWDWRPGQPPSYPGHFLAPSRHTFQPHPGDDAAEFGLAHGRALRAALRLLVEDWRANGIPQQPLAKAIMAHPLAQADADFAARTLAGTVMGFVPTLDGALRALAHEWWRDGTFWSLRARHGGTLFDYSTAQAHLQDSLARALQLRAVPDLIWRTAANAHRIGAVEVAPGEVVVFGLASAAQQELAALRPDLARSMFGGVRSGAGPTHACPGYDAAVAVMLGAAAGLVATTQPLSQVGTAVALRIEGDSGEPLVVHESAIAARPQIRTFKAAANGMVMVWGDSWVNHIYALLRQNFKWQIDDANFDVPGADYPFDDVDWLNLSSMGRAASDVSVRAKVASQIKIRKPRAIVLSGGGNDASNATLLRLVRKKGELDGPLNKPEVAAFVHTELRDHYLAVIGLIQSLPDPDGRIVPIVLHGYDHPLPRVGGGSLGSFLCGKLGYTVAEAAEIMKDLIDELNLVMTTLPGLCPQGKVTHVDLTGTLANSTDPNVGWIDELHPNRHGFALLAKAIIAAL